MADTTVDRYASLAWSPEDVQTLRPYWSLDRCRRELEQNEKYIRDRLCELGWDVIGALIASEEVYVIASKSEHGFWSNDSGWCAFGSATIFDEEEKKCYAPPMSTGNDAVYIKLQDAEAEFGLHPENPVYDGKARDPSDRREESTVQVLCRKLLSGGFVTLSDTDGPTPILERNIGALTVLANDDGEARGEFVITEVAFGYLSRFGVVRRITMAQLIEANPMGVDGFLLHAGNELWIHPRAIKAVFQPQAWVNDYTVEIDGRCDVDVTKAVLALDLASIQAMANDDYGSDHLVNVDELGHSGPFVVRVELALQQFFAVEDVHDITQAMLDAARQKFHVVGL